MSAKQLSIFIFLVYALIGCNKNEPGTGSLELRQIFVGSTEINLTGPMSEDLPVDRNISLVFSTPVDKSSAINSITLRSEIQTVDIDFNFLSQDKNIAIYPVGILSNNTIYTLVLSNQLKGANGENFESREVKFKTVLGELIILSIEIGGIDIGDADRITDVPMDFKIVFNFSAPINGNSFDNAAKLTGPDAPDLEISFSNNDQTVNVTGLNELHYLTRYEFALSNSLKGAEGEGFTGYTLTFYTELDSTFKFPEVSDEELLNKVQQQTFKYFWDFGHPVSGLSRERNTSDQTVTSGGSGFGIMAIIVGIERGFITRSEGISRLSTMINFLEQSDRFHGAWSHWLNGTTGKVIPFSPNDDGGDLVETSYLVMGLLTLRQYLDNSIAIENDLIKKINDLWESVEWDWYTQGENSLTWHWSPNFGWEKNMKIRGWNEALITYIMAASSATHSISKDVYDGGWTNSNHFLNGKSFYNITLPLGQDYGGPLFFEQYTFLGIDPRSLKDVHVEYWDQVVNHTLINREHCKINPLGYVGYNEYCWGLTASDGNNGYSAHSPTNDRGVITPTAALSSIPFTPMESMDALKHFYYILGDRLWGPYGFYDAFNITENWYASSNIAIDQGPIIIMIENYRTGLLWNLFMACPEIQQGLNNLGFTY